MLGFESWTSPTEEDDMFVAMASRHAHQIRTVGLFDVLAIDLGTGS